MLIILGDAKTDLPVSVGIEEVEKEVWGTKALVTRESPQRVDVVLNAHLVPDLRRPGVHSRSITNRTKCIFEFEVMGVRK